MSLRAGLIAAVWLAAMFAPVNVEAQIYTLTREQLVELSGYARVDLRLDSQGQIHVLEANPNPQIARSEDFAESAKHAGMNYPALLQRILTTGLRWEPERLG